MLLAFLKKIQEIRLCGFSWPVGWLACFAGFGDYDMLHGVPSNFGATALAGAVVVVVVLRRDLCWAAVSAVSGMRQSNNLLLPMIGRLNYRRAVESERQEFDIEC